MFASSAIFELVQHMKMIEEDRNVAFREVKNLMEENDRMKKENEELIAAKSQIEHDLREVS